MEYLNHLDIQTYNTVLYCWGVLGILSAFAIHFAHLLPMSSRKQSKELSFLGTIDKRLGWIIMETPVLVAVIYFFLIGDKPFNISAVIIGAFVFHYINRSLIYPYRIKVKGKTLPLSMVLTSMVFYVINGYLIGYYFGSLREYSIDWLADPRFIIGALLFVIGFSINVHSDNILIKLRAPGETDYKIPQGGFFKYVSCPNYFGEIIEWIGFAIMSWSLPGVVYAIWVVLPLFAQGVEAHHWYVEKFKDDYPKNRKAVIPGLI